MVLQSPIDYNCYVDAIYQLYNHHILKNCDFVNRQGEFHKNIHLKHFFNAKFLDKNKYYHEQKDSTEYMFVIDNTVWPEAITSDD